MSNSIQIRFDHELTSGVTVEVVGHYSPHRPGRYDGPPERCYPEEPEDVELSPGIFLDGSRIGMEWEAANMTPADHRAIRDEIFRRGRDWVNDAGI